MKALLIVDVQKDFMPGGALPVPEGDLIIPSINQLIQKSDLVVASKDWHPENHISFQIWPPHCIAKSAGSDFPENLESHSIAHIAYKGSDPLIDSYSAFFDQEKGRTTTLEAFLRKKRVTDLIVVGVATEYCVRATVLDALALGFKVALFVPGCRGLDLESSAHALSEMQERGAELWGKS